MPPALFVSVCRVGTFEFPLWTKRAGLATCPQTLPPSMADLERRSYWRLHLYRCTRPEIGSALDFDLDLARLGGFLLGKRDGQDAVLEAGIDLIGIEAVGHGEAAGKRAVAALHPV